jgi:histidinol-phosphate phosphatase family protein
MSLQGLRIDGSWTLFLDRDGVINRRIVDGYVKDWNSFEFLPGVIEALRRFSGMFGNIIVVSNQQGVGKGLMTEAAVNAIHKKMREVVHKEGGRIDAVFFSPHLESAHSIFRKPGIGMALRARKQFPGLKFKHAIMAGDSFSDMLFGKRAGMKTVFLSENTRVACRHPEVIDYQFPNLLSFAEKL